MGETEVIHDGTSGGSPIKSRHAYLNEWSTSPVLYETP